MKYPIKPYLYASEPETFLVNSEKIKSIPLFSDEKVEIPELEKDQVIYFEKDRDDDCYLVVYRETKVPNPNYEKQLAVYNEAKAEYDVQLAEYHKKLNELGATIENVLDLIYQKGIEHGRTQVSKEISNTLGIPNSL